MPGIALGAVLQPIGFAGGVRGVAVLSFALLRAGSPRWPVPAAVPGLGLWSPGAAHAV